MKNKNIKKLTEFSRFCLDHPNWRFWQCVRNYSKFSFIFAWNPRPNDKNKDKKLEEFYEKGILDTFYWK